MKTLIGAILFLSASLGSAAELKTVVHSICLNAVQATYMIDMTSPVILSDSTSLSDFKLQIAGVEHGIVLIDLILMNASGGPASNDRKILAFPKEQIDPKIAAILFQGNMLFVRTLNRTTDYITVKSCL